MAQVTPEHAQHQRPLHARKTVADIGIDDHRLAHMRRRVVADRSPGHKTAGTGMAAQRQQQVIEHGALNPLQSPAGREDHTLPARLLGPQRSGVGRVELVAGCRRAPGRSKHRHQRRCQLSTDRTHQFQHRRLARCVALQQHDRALQTIQPQRLAQVLVQRAQPPAVAPGAGQQRHRALQRVASGQ